MSAEDIDIDALDFTSIVQLRRALHRIGVSSSTPGLNGTKRMRELGKRVRIAAGDIVASTKEEEEEDTYLLTSQEDQLEKKQAHLIMTYSNTGTWKDGTSRGFVGTCN